VAGSDGAGGISAAIRLEDTVAIVSVKKESLEEEVLVASCASCTKRFTINK
jgi:hypothetical protein